MSDLCQNGTTIPTLTEEICSGVYTSDNCIIHSEAITALNLPVNSSVRVILNALVLAIQYKEEQIQTLTERIEALE